MCRCRGRARIGRVNDRGTNKTGTVVVSQKSTSGRRAARVRAGLQPLECSSVANRGGKKGLAALHGPLANTKLLFLYRGAKMFTAFGRGMYRGVPTDAERGKNRKRNVHWHTSPREKRTNFPILYAAREFRFCYHRVCIRLSKYHRISWFLV